MNPLLQELLTMAPGMAAGVRGNGNGMKAFMDAYQQTQAHLDEQARTKTLMAQQTQDRQRNIERQGQSDAWLAQEHARQLQQQSQQDALQRLQIPGELAKVGGAANTPEDAKRMIESLMPELMKAFGPETLALGQPAVEMAQQTITGRQKRQMKDFVDEVLKLSHVADNPDSDPEIANLPEHVQKLIGKPSAKLSELQAFAELPIGKPQGKERIPAAAGSFEEYSSPTTTPERKAQIEKDRKGYMQADDRPRVDVNINGGLNPNQEANLSEKLGKDWNTAIAPTREVNRQFSLMETGLQRFRAGDKNGGSQAVLVTFQKILDPNSVVRESEYARSAEGISMLGRLQGYVTKLQSGGAGVPERDLAQMVETARQMKDAVAQTALQQRSRIEALAKKYKIAPEMIFGAEAPASTAPSGQIIVTAPDGSKHPFDTQAQADMFKKLAGIK